jgi:hypothetical protein
MKHFILMIFVIFSSGLCAQTEFKNTVYFGYSLLEASSAGKGGQISAKGFDISYSRYLKNRFYGDISYGQKNFEGRNDSFFLDPSEMAYFNMKIFTLGFGYDVFQSERFILSGELAYLRQSNEELMSLLQSGSITIRQTGWYVDQTARLQLKGRIFITKNLQVISSVGHGLRLSRYSSVWFRAGMACSF